MFGLGWFHKRIAAEARLKEHQRLYENTQTILREFGAETAEIIPGIESPIEKTMTFNDYCERIRVSQETLSVRNERLRQDEARRQAEQDIEAWPNINSKLKIRLPHDYVEVQEECNKNYGCSQDLKHKQKIINAVWIVLTKRPWLAYRECEDVSNEILAELERINK